MALCYSGCTIFLFILDLSLIKKLRNYALRFLALIINKIKKKSVVIAYVPHND